MDEVEFVAKEHLGRDQVVDLKGVTDGRGFVADGRRAALPAEKSLNAAESAAGHLEQPFNVQRTMIYMRDVHVACA